MATKKIGFDSARLKQFFLLHGEKVALAVGLSLAGYLAYGATQVTPYAKKPKDLQTAVSQGRVRLDNSHKNMDIAKDGIKKLTGNEDFVKVIERELINPLLASRFAAAIEWNRPLFPKALRRREPTFLAVRDLRTTFYHGAVNIKGAGDGGGAPFGEEFIAVTGVVPFEEQMAAHAKAFQNALDPKTNATPLYSRYEIRRAEVKDPNEVVDWDKIEPINLQAAVIDWLGKWSERAEDGADPSVVSWPPDRGYGPLTEPLPPLTNKDYGPWATHPELVAVATAPGQPVPAAPVAPAAPQKPLGDVFGGGGAAVPAVQPVAAPIAGAADPAQARPKQLLFRFLDFNIEEGKSYRYRVKLILRNPNLNLDPAHLEKPELAVGDTRDAPWSDASTTTAYPYLDRQFAGHLKFVSGDIEPEAGTGVKWWFPKLAAEGYIRFEEIKGTPATGITITGRMRGAALSGDVKVNYLAPGNREPKTAAVNFPPPPVPSILLVDFAWERVETRPMSPGGRTISRPSEVLLLNPRGELKIALQTMDASLWGEQKAATGTGNGAAPPAVQPGGVQLLGGAQPAGAIPPPAAGATPTGAAPVLRLQ